MTRMASRMDRFSSPLKSYGRRSASIGRRSSRFMASWAISASSRSSFMKSDCIISWSCWRWPGERLCISDCIWPICLAICSSSWSRLSAPGKFCPHLSLKAWKSGSPPWARSLSMRFKSLSISRMRFKSSGVRFWSPCCMPCMKGLSICSWSERISSSNLRFASASVKGYSWSALICPAGSGGIASRRWSFCSCWAPGSTSRSMPARSVWRMSASCFLISSSAEPRSYCSRRCWRSCRRRLRRSWSPGMRPPCGSCAPRWKRRCSAFQRSPSASRSSDMADRSWSASRSGTAWVPSQREYRLSLAMAGS